MAVAIFALLTPCHPVFAVELFGPRLSVPACNSPKSVGVGDFNGDGVADLALPCAGILGVLLSDGLGGFERVPDFDFGGFLQSVAVGDFDLDGALDLALGDQWSRRVNVVFGDGHGSFCNGVGGAGDCPVDGYDVGLYPYSIVAGDFNNDGTLDLAVALKNEDSVRVLLGGKQGRFSPPGPAFAVGDEPRSMVQGDFNDDGDLDLATADLEGDSVSLLFGDGVGGFPVTRQVTLGGRPRYLAAGDLDLDGDTDLAVAKNGENAVSLLLNDGGGEFVPTQDIDVGDAPIWVSVADIDADDDPDLLVANLDAKTVSVLRNVGRGGFAKVPDITVGSRPTALAVAQFDRNAAVDLVVVHGDSDSVGFLPGDGLGGLAVAHELAVPLAAEGYPQGCVVVGDLNGDAHPDLAVAGREANAIGILLGDGHGEYSAAPDIEIPSPACLAVADVNADGDLDLVAPQFGVESWLNILHGDGTGKFSHVSSIEVAPRAVKVAVGDVNLDGWPDLAVAHDDSGGLYADLVLSDGEGGFRPFRSISVCSAQHCNPEYVTLVDVDVDGALDLVVAAHDAELVSILPGQGDGTFGVPREINVGVPPNWVGVSDLDRDGDLDLAFSSFFARQVGALLADEQGRFDPTPVLDFEVGPSNPMIADLNGDGVPDLATSLLQSNALTILLGDGHGNFNRTLDVSVGRAPASAVATDLDGDGLSDLAVCNTGDGTLGLLWNRLPDRADVNGSNRVDGFDVNAIGVHGGISRESAGYRRTVDVDLNGVIDGDDLSWVADGFGRIVNRASPLRASFEPESDSVPDTVTIQPHTSQGDRITVEVRVNDDDPVAAAAFGVLFAPDDGDPEPALEFVAHDPGTYFSGGAVQLYTIDDGTPGRVDVTVQRLPNEERAGAGEEPLIYLTFAARRAGSAMLEFTAPTGRAGAALLDANEHEVSGATFVDGGRVSVSTTSEGSQGQRIDVTPLELNFGDVRIGAQGSEKLLISNLGFSELEVSAVGLNPDLAEFRSFFTSAVIIPAFGSVELTVEFRPASAGVFSTEMWIRSDDPIRSRVQVALRGRSGMP